MQVSIAHYFSFEQIQESILQTRRHGQNVVAEADSRCAATGGNVERESQNGNR